MKQNPWLKLAAVSFAGILISFAILWGVQQFSSYQNYNNIQTYMNGMSGSYNINGMMQGNRNSGMNMQGSMNGGMNMQGNMSGGMNMQGGSGMMGGMNSGSGSMNMQGGSSSSGMGMMDDMMGGMM